MNKKVELRESLPRFPQPKKTYFDEKFAVGGIVTIEKPKLGKDYREWRKKMVVALLELKERAQQNGALESEGIYINIDNILDVLIKEKETEE